jgi:hypothetical protein
MLAVIYSSSNPTQTQDDQKLTNFLEQVASGGIAKSRLLPKNNGKGGNPRTRQHQIVIMIQVMLKTLMIML